MAQISVLGAGGWGMALAMSAYSGGNQVKIWSPFEEEVRALREQRGNERLLPGVKLPEEIEITTDLSCVRGSELTILAVPSIAIRQTAQRLATQKDYGILVNVSKGLEKDTLLRLSQVIRSEIPDAPIGVLSGPSHAEEVSRKVPTSIVAASDSVAVATVIQDVMSTEFLRVYTSDDLIGVELGGALKNVIAICAGFCDGLGLGDNSKAALITRGLAEMARLGLCMGAKEHTFAGLTGIGDLVVTCTSRHSRNNRFGFKVGTGMPVADALREVGTVEGYYAAQMAHDLSKKYKIEMPIIERCYRVLYENANVKDAVRELMTRPQRAEH